MRTKRRFAVSMYNDEIFARFEKALFLFMDEQVQLLAAKQQSTVGFLRAV